MDADGTYLGTILGPGHPDGAGRRADRDARSPRIATSGAAPGDAGPGLRPDQHLPADGRRAGPVGPVHRRRGPDRRRATARRPWRTATAWRSRSARWSCWQHPADGRRAAAATGGRRPRAKAVQPARSERAGARPATASRCAAPPAPPPCGCGCRSCRSPRRGSCGRSPGTGAARPAMSATVAPSTAALRTSRSRGVSGLGPALSAAAASAGSMTRSPASTRRIAAASSSTGPSLTRNPDAPASIARRR